jgi:putative transcriptional regulator
VASNADFAPGFLVAAPSLSCPFFNHAVVLLIDHGDDGSFGIVVNKPAPVRFGEVLGDLRVPIEVASPPDLPVHVGGPVSPDTGWLIFDPAHTESKPGQALAIGDSLALTSSFEMLQAIAQGGGPERVIMSLGYSGWGPGQLESEMKEGSWIPTDVDASIVYEVPIEERWEKALRAAGIDPAWVITRDLPKA